MTTDYTPHECRCEVCGISLVSPERIAQLLEQNRKMWEILDGLSHSESCSWHVPPVMDANCPACRWGKLKREDK